MYVYMYVYIYIYIYRERERDLSILSCPTSCECTPLDGPLSPARGQKVISPARMPLHPVSLSKMWLFSDPSLGKSCAITYQPKVSGQSNPWNESWTANSWYENCVYLNFAHPPFPAARSTDYYLGVDSISCNNLPPLIRNPP